MQVFVTEMQSSVFKPAVRGSNITYGKVIYFSEFETQVFIHFELLIVNSQPIRCYPAIPGNDQIDSSTNRKTSGSKLDRTS